LARRFLLTVEAFKGCGGRPRYRLLLGLAEAAPGEEVEIVGEDAVLGFDTLLGMLEDEGFDYEVLERDDLLGSYRVAARRRG